MPQIFEKFNAFLNPKFHRRLHKTYYWFVFQDKPFKLSNLKV